MSFGIAKGGTSVKEKPHAKFSLSRLCAALLILAAVAALSFSRSAAGEAVCIGPREMLEYFKTPPRPMPSTVMWGMLEGDQARAFVRQTGGASMVSFVGVVYLFHVPRKFPNQIIATLADAAGCVILMSGKRTVDTGKGAGQAFSKSLVEAFLRSFNLPVPNPLRFEV
jgi:hypothetical protein